MGGTTTTDLQGVLDSVRSCNLVMLGEAPGNYPRYDPAYHALFPYPPGCAGARLRKLMGMGMSEYVALSRQNLFPHYPGRQGKGAKFPQAEARDLVARIQAEGTLSDKHVLMVGSRVATAFGVGTAPILTWHQQLSYRFAVVPHTSGINRWWNDSDNAAAGEAFLRRVADQARAGAQAFT